MRAAEIEQHAVVAGHRNDQHFGDRWRAGRRTGDVGLLQIELPQGFRAAYCSGVIFPVSITVFQREISSAMKLANWLLLLPTTSKPTASNFALTSGSFAEAASSASSFARIAAD